jgi:hypothetical protein
VCLLAGVLPASAQFGGTDLPPAEDYRVEAGASLFRPSPDLRIQTGALAQITTGEVDFVREFSIEDKFFTEFHFIARPGRRHKIRFNYLGVRYEESATLERTITFGGRTFTVGVPATADLKWDLWRFGYEWDFVSRDRGFVGVIGELKHNRVSADLTALGIAAVAYEADAPVPTIGIIGRGYPHPLVSITGEFTGFKLADVFSDEFEAELYDLDIYGTVSVGRHVGIRGGYRSVVADYVVDEDAGDLKLQGLYFGGVVRF